MARTIARIGGTAVAPGVSLNRRWYTRDIIAGAVAKAQERIGGDGLPLTMLTHHGADDDSTRIVGKVTSMTLAEDGSARFTADIADTEHGRTIAALADDSAGGPFLKTISLRGAWEGKVSRVTGPDGQPAERGQGLSFDGFDFTKTPGVGSAKLDTFAWAGDGQNETTERVLITESVQEAAVTFTEAAGTGETGTEQPNAPAAPPEGLRETLAVVLGPVREADNATPAMSKRGSGMSGGGRKWADPGYQTDKKQRYDITTKTKALTAWRYINQASKAAKYSSSQLKNIKSRIRAALKGFGVSVSTEAAPGWGFGEAHQISEAVAEWYGDPSSSGSWCVSASNGPVNLSLSSYCMDPADLDVIIRAAADAVCKALAALDPDMDGDVDVPGVGDGSDTDGDSGHESAPDPELTEATGPGQPADARETTNGTEAPVTTEATTTQGGSAPSATPEPAAAAAAETAPAAPAETGEQRTARIVAEALKAAGVGQPAPPAEETEEQRVARLVAEALKAQGAAPAAPAAPAVTETEEQRIDRVVGERLASAGFKPPAEVTEEEKIDNIVTERLQRMVADGSIAVRRSGLLVREHNVPTGEADNPGKTEGELAKTSEDEFFDYAGGALVKNAEHTRAFGGVR